jgi:8-oxo-dGTP pyrophosphatase MutT (NUDIX family)
VSSDRLEPGAELNTGEVAVPRLAATVMLLRGGADRLEVLLAKRTPAARFMGGAWVFPGGAVSAEDGEDGEDGERRGALQAAAVRELSEEVGVHLPAGAELVAFANWITPEAVRIRFDTWFFLAVAPERAEPQVDGSEIVDARWFEPALALTSAERGQIMLVFPTIKQLEQISAFTSVDALVDYARHRTVRPVQPRVLRPASGEIARIVLPGEPGYDD